LTKKERRALLKDKVTPNTSLKLITIKPLTKNQELAYDAFYNNKHLFLHGVAGTGKSLVSLFLALDQVMSGLCIQNKVIIVRSAVPSRDIGFLPGSVKDKIREYELPYRSICTDLFQRGDAYDVLKSKNIVEFMSTSFVRGLTIRDSIVILDEIQNMSYGEIYSVLTRMGRNCRVIISGDYRQSDLERSGVQKLIRVVRKMKSFAPIEFGIQDIVRSDFVRELIIASNEDDIKCLRTTYSPEQN
jgi:phosphate starvation-inducible protein PhoH